MTYLAGNACSDRRGRWRPQLPAAPETTARPLGGPDAGARRGSRGDLWPSCSAAGPRHAIAVKPSEPGGGTTAATSRSAPPPGTAPGAQLVADGAYLALRRNVAGPSLSTPGSASPPRWTKFVEALRRRQRRADGRLLEVKTPPSGRSASATPRAGTPRLRLVAPGPAPRGPRERRCGGPDADRRRAPEPGADRGLGRPRRGADLQPRRRGVAPRRTADTHDRGPRRPLPPLPPHPRRSLPAAPDLRPVRRRGSGAGARLSRDHFVPPTRDPRSDRCGCRPRVGRPSGSVRFLAGIDRWWPDGKAWRSSTDDRSPELSPRTALTRSPPLTSSAFGKGALLPGSGPVPGWNCIPGCSSLRNAPRPGALRAFGPAPPTPYATAGRALGP